uniref:FTH domain-containing protein n=1 Tax=Caenorhabditis tropicalis TaxID=1561998 RepID=A0A1I7V2X3_9PELO
MAPQLGRTATWNDLPIEFVMSVAKYLDFKSRQTFRQCAKREKFSVDDIPINLDMIAITPKLEYFSRKQLFKFETYEKVVILTSKQTIASLLRIFGHKNSSVEFVEIGNQYTKRNAKKLLELIKKLYVQVDVLDKPMSWNVKQLVWNASSDEKVFPKFLGFLNAERLNSLTVGYFKNKNGTNFEVVSRMEQWQKLGEAHIGDSKNLSCGLSSFHHLTVVRLMMNAAQPQDINLFIEKILEKSNLPMGSYFALKCDKPIFDSNFISHIAMKFNDPIIRCQRIYIRMFQLELLKFVFPHDPEFSLMVFGIENALFGYIVHDNRFGWDITERFIRFKFSDMFRVWPRDILQIQVDW